MTQSATAVEILNEECFLVNCPDTSRRRDSPVQASRKRGGGAHLPSGGGLRLKMGANPTVVTLPLTVWREGKQHKFGSKILPAGRTVGRWMTLSFVELQKAQLPLPRDCCLANRLGGNASTESVHRFGSTGAISLTLPILNMLRRRVGRESEATTTAKGRTAEDEDVRAVVVANHFRTVTYSLAIFVALVACSGLQIVAADKTTPSRLRRHGTNRLDISEILELGGYSESRHNRQRELGKKRKKVS